MGSGEISTPLWIKCVYGFVCFLCVCLRVCVRSSERAIKDPPPLRAPPYPAPPPPHPAPPPPYPAPPPPRPPRGNALHLNQNGSCWRINGCLQKSQPPGGAGATFTKPETAASFPSLVLHRPSAAASRHAAHHLVSSEALSRVGPRDASNDSHAA